MIFVGIATTGRPDILSKTLELVCRQTRRPDKILVCPGSPGDLGTHLPDCSVDIEIVEASLGSASQRNGILRAAGSADIVVFFHDDFFAASDYLDRCESLFARHDDVVVATGLVMADGIGGPGLDSEKAEQMLRIPDGGNGAISPIYGAYGCNMAIRMLPVRKHSIRFDENLPLYAWQEDVDFSRQLAPFGRIVHYSGMRGIHLGHKKGRTSGVRLGYSQIANAWYLIRKGTLSVSFAGRLAVKNFLANSARSLFPEPWVDRRGRLRGNLLAMVDIARGRCNPRRILDL